MKINVVLAGVGGQGVVTMARLLAAAALRDGLYVVQGELHGMSQRGGTVQAQLRFSDKPIESPQVPKGRADLIIGVEPLEALRSADWLHPGGHVIAAMKPFENIKNYPPIEDVHDSLRSIPTCLMVDAFGIAKEAGAVRSMNFAVCGAALNFLPMTAESMRAVILEKAITWTERDRDAAIAALDAGIEVGRTTPVA